MALAFPSEEDHEPSSDITASVLLFFCCCFGLFFAALRFQLRERSEFDATSHAYGTQEQDEFLPPLTRGVMGLLVGRDPHVWMRLQVCGSYLKCGEP